MEKEITEKLASLLAPVAEAEGCALFSLEYKPGMGSSLLRVYIDKEGGVSVDDCARVSKQAGYVLDAEDVIPGSYVLEVSSPGLTRPLKTPQDFIRSIGKLALVSARRIEPGGKGGKALGVIEKADMEKVELRSKTGELAVINQADITKARLEVEF